MINLLPPKDKKELELVRRKQLTIVLGNLITVSLFCLLLVIVSLKFYILSQEDSQKNLLKIAQQSYETPDFVSSKMLMQKYNNLVERANNFYLNQFSFSDVLRFISQIQRPEKFLISNIGFEKGSDRVKVIISGISDTRDSLLVFKSNLENSRLEGRYIKTIYFSPDSWIKPKDAIFNVTFELVKI